MAEPVVAPVYRPFPRCLYRQGEMVLAHDARDQQAKLDDGWSVSPDPPAPEVIQESADVTIEEVSAEPTISAAPKKRGRPPKAKAQE